MVCKRCFESKNDDLFYPKDSTCKECRKRMVRENRAAKIEYYREYDRHRFQNDPRVVARHKRYQATDKGVLSLSKAKAKWTENNAIKRGASFMVNNAVRDGRLEKQYVCSECGTNKGRIHGHHDDYAFPLVVRWLCSKCHTEWHKENGPGKNG